MDKQTEETTKRENARLKNELAVARKEIAELTRQNEKLRDILAKSSNGKKE
jgi:hypothetical protein